MDEGPERGQSSGRALLVNKEEVERNRGAKQSEAEVSKCPHESDKYCGGLLMEPSVCATAPQAAQDAGKGACDLQVAAQEELHSDRISDLLE